MSDIVARLRAETRDCRLNQSLHTEAAGRIERLQTENAQLAAKVRNLTALLDRKVGTPCEQIRHEQEIEQLKAETADEIKQLRDETIRLKARLLEWQNEAADEIERLRATVRVLKGSRGQ